MLEDDYTYVIRKALKGLALTPDEAASRAALPVSEVLAFSRGDFSETTARRLAPVLHLDAEALANHPRYLPRPLALPSVHRLDLPFGQERVNAWLIWENDTAILFDTGYDPASCAVALDAIGAPPLQHIFITHGHHDHTGGIPDFQKRGIPLHRPGHEIQPGDTLRCGPLSVRACDLSGHASPSLGYHVAGLSSPLLITGDALFAGSIGGCGSPALYQHALARLREILSPLPATTVLLPGHGPATTLGEERSANPFLPLAPATGMLPSRFTRHE
jgi:glyoxylase-like metal-dependent hydrolase (beta-lactamase superfamily II)